MSATEISTVECRQFIGGEWVEAVEGGSVRGPRSLHR